MLQLPLALRCLEPLREIEEHIGNRVGADSLESVGANIDIGRKKLSVGSGPQPLLESYDRRFALELKPEKYRALTEARADKDQLAPKLAHPVRPSVQPRGRVGSLVLKACVALRLLRAARRARR